MNKKILLTVSFMVMTLSSYSLSAGAMKEYFLRLNEFKENIHQVGASLATKYPAEMEQLDELCTQLGCTYDTLPVDIQAKYGYVLNEYQDGVTQCVDTYFNKAHTRLLYTMVGVWVVCISAMIAVKLYDYYQMKFELKESAEDNQSCDEKKDDASVTDLQADLAHQ